MLKRFIAYYKPHKKMFALDMLAAFFISLTSLVYPVITREMLDRIMYGGNRWYTEIIYAGILVLLVYLLKMGFSYFVQYYGHMIGTKMQAQMRRDIFSHLESLPYSYFDNNETGQILSRITSDLFDVSELAHHGPENLIISSLTVIGSFVYLCTIDVYLTLIIFACVPFLLVISWYFRKKMRAAFKERRVTTAGINAAIESSVTGIRVTKAFSNNEQEFEKFNKNNNLFVEACKKSYRAMAMFHCSSTFVTDIFNVIIIIAGGLFLHGDKIDVAEYSTFIVSVNVFINPVTTLIGFMEQYQNGVSGFSRFLEVMDEQSEKENEGAADITDVKGEICFNDVTFGYNDEVTVLNNVSLKIEKGQKLALVGHSGGGKTTICHLIPAFYRVSGGSITLDGVNINDITFKSLRNNIGIVQQDVFLFGGSIYDNILYGRPDATKEEVITAAKRARIHDYIMSLEQGYDTEIGERGVRLSGGQKQRVSIARVFLKNPAVLILDEATSALDNTTEVLIQRALDELCVGRTTLVVAHRLSTIKNADSIAVIEEGRVVEQGTHDYLIKKGGAYSELCTAIGMDE